jgi:hypothetical protein
LGVAVLQLQYVRVFAAYRSFGEILMTMVSRWLLAVAMCAILACGPSSKSEPEAKPPAQEQVAESVAAEAAAPAAEPEPEPASVEVKESEVPKGSPDPVSDVAKLADGEGVALVPTDGAIPEEVLNLFMAQANPVPSWVSIAFQTPTQAEADGAPIRALLEQVSSNKKAIDKQRSAVRARVQQLLRTERGTELPKGKPVSRGLPSLDSLIPVLDAAKVTVFEKPAPILGGADQGMAVASLALVFAAKVADSIVKRDGTASFLWSRRMARFGALVARQARTLGELSGAVMAVQDALALQELAGSYMVAVLKGGDTFAGGDFRVPRRRLGTWAASLARVGKLLRTPTDVPLWTRIARGQPDPVWRYEAFKNLFMLAAFHKGAPGADEARAALESMANDPGKGLSKIGAHWLARLNKVE